jgi:biotin transport system substrate-specific component
MAAVVALGAQVAIPIPPLGVSLTLQGLAVILTGLLLGPVDGGVALAVYVGMGAVGLPVFAFGRGGFGALFEPTGGFLYGFVAQAALTGWWSRYGPGQGTARLAAAVAVGYLPTFLAGVLGLVQFGGMPFGAAVKTVAIFAPVAALKGLVGIQLFLRVAPRLPEPFRSDAARAI